MNLTTGVDTPLSLNFAVGKTYTLQRFANDLGYRELRCAPFTVDSIWYEDDIGLFTISGSENVYPLSLLTGVVDYTVIDEKPSFELGHRYEFIPELRNSFISRCCKPDEFEQDKNMQRRMTQQAVLSFIGNQFTTTRIENGHVAEIAERPNETPQENGLTFVVEAEERRYFRDLGSVEKPGQDKNTGLEARLRALFELPDSSFVIRCDHTGQNDRVKSFDEFYEWLNVQLTLGLSHMDTAKVRYKENLDEVTRIGDTVREVLGK